MATNLFNFGPELDAIFADAQALVAYAKNEATFESKVLAALASLAQQGNQLMALIDDITAALANLNTQVSAVATDLQNFAADLAAALAGNNTAAAQAALTGITQAASALQAAVAANQAPAPTGATGATGP